MEDKGIYSSKIYWIYILILVVLNVSIIAAPYFAMKGEEEIASSIYNFFIPLDHQWIYRSFCLFEENGNVYINECIAHNEKEPTYIETRFTDFNKGQRGVFKYNRDEIGVNRADFLIRGEKKGYKLAVCARDTGFYFALLLGSLIYPFFFSRDEYFSLPFLLLSAVPIGFDGTFQLLTSYESTVIFRFFTGIMSGVLLGILITGNIVLKINKKE